MARIKLLSRVASFYKEGFVPTAAENRNRTYHVGTLLVDLQVPIDTEAYMGAQPSFLRALCSVLPRAVCSVLPHAPCSVLPRALCSVLPQ